MVSKRTYTHGIAIACGHSPLGRGSRWRTRGCGSDRLPPFAPSTRGCGSLRRGGQRWANAGIGDAGTYRAIVWSSGSRLWLSGGMALASTLAGRYHDAGSSPYSGAGMKIVI